MAEAGSAVVTDEADEGDLIPLSALQHYLFCPRQCALIHVEQAWAENRFTAEGRVLHEATAEVGAEKRRGVRVVTAMPLVSRRLGVSGIADLVEMHHDRDGSWLPFPVEYKRGKPKAHRADEVQLCAQAMAIEEMFGVTLEEGALFYGETRRRLGVSLNAGLRQLTAEVAHAAHHMLGSGSTPPAVFEKRKCTNCSLREICQPKRLSRPLTASAWLVRQITEG
jgi:CRISPR-associated exonuclease Cas4